MMKMLTQKAVVIAMMLSPIMSNVVLADEAALSQRIDRLERIIQGQGLVSLLGRVDQQQNEIKKLNGDNESLRHEIESMKKKQRELYLDIDKRLQEQAAAAQTPAAMPQDNQQTLPDSNSSVNDGGLESVDQALNTNTQQSQGAPVAVENGEAAYQSALQVLRSGQYEQAVAALAAFPTQYPQSSYLPNAYYWQGEANYVLRHFEAAIAAFQTVIDTYPASTKVADSMLKLGFSQYELGNVDAAKLTLNNVIQQYSNTSAAKLATVRLDRIKEETR
jgi:tol-pal system protein YbgF